MSTFRLLDTLTAHIIKYYWRLSWKATEYLRSQSGYQKASLFEKQWSCQIFQNRLWAQLALVSHMMSSDEGFQVQSYCIIYLRWIFIKIDHFQWTIHFPTSHVIDNKVVNLFLQDQLSHQLVSITWRGAAKKTAQKYQIYILVTCEGQI